MTYQRIRIRNISQSMPPKMIGFDSTHHFVAELPRQHRRCGLARQLPAQGVKLLAGDSPPVLTGGWENPL